LGVLRLKEVGLIEIKALIMQRYRAKIIIRFGFLTIMGLRVPTAMVVTQEIF